MTQSTNILVDRTALARNRRRATRSSSDLFLQTTALAEIEDRLEMVNKSFTAPAIVTPFPRIWKGVVPDAICVPDSETIDLQPLAHDLVIHSLGLHWSNDPVGQLIQCRRALRPDGLLLCACLGENTLAELRSVLAQAEISETGGLSPRVSPMAELREMGALLQRAGFALPVADKVTLNASYQTSRHLMQDLRAMGEANALQDRLRTTTRRGIFEQAQGLYQSVFPTEQGGVAATFDVLFLTGWAPDASQPKALRPGSAQMRLADALGTPQTPEHD